MSNYEADAQDQRSLSDLLDSIEARLGKSALTSRSNVLTLFRDLDAVAVRISDRNAQNLPTRPEEAQFNAIQAQLRKESRRMLRTIGGNPALIDERNQVRPPDTHWWWFLDAYLHEERKKAVRRLVRMGAIGVIVLIVLAVVYQLFLKPDPLVVAEFEAENQSKILAGQGDLNGALTVIADALKIVPESGNLYVIQGVVFELLEKPDEAEKSFSKSEELLGTREIYVLVRSQTEMELGRPIVAFDLLTAYLQENANSAKSYLLLGQANELLGKRADAVQAYEMASTVGNETDDATTVAQARIKLGMLMQSLDYTTVETPTP